MTGEAQMIIKILRQQMTTFTTFTTTTTLTNCNDFKRQLNPLTYPDSDLNLSDPEYPVQDGSLDNPACFGVKLGSIHAMGDRVDDQDDE